MALSSIKHNSTILKRLVLVILAVILLGIIMAIISGGKKCCPSNQILLLADKNPSDSGYEGRQIKAFLLSPDGKKISEACSFSFPYERKMNGREKLNNLVGNSKGNSYYFFEPAESDKKFECRKIHFSKGKIAFKTIFSDKSIWEDGRCFRWWSTTRITGIDPMERNLLTNDGHVINLKTLTCKSCINLAKVDEKKDIDDYTTAVGSAFINKYFIISQAINAYDSHNYLVLNNYKGNLQKVVPYQFAPRRTRRPEDFYHNLPVELSPDGIYAAFLSVDTDPDKTYTDSIKLSLLNTISLETQKVTDLPVSLLATSEDNCDTIMKWRPGSNSGIIAFEDVYNSFMLIDVKNKRLLRKVESAYFHIDDITDFPSILATLKNPELPYYRKIAEAIDSQVIMEDRKKLSDNPVKESIKRSVRFGLNRILSDTRFYNEEEFSELPLSDEEKQPAAKGVRNLSKNDLVCFNRLLLEKIYRKEIKRNSRTTMSFETKSLRWSPDGKRIGILSWDGELFIYDVDKDSLEKVAEDRDYFDFFWTE